MKKNALENYLERIPIPKENLDWFCDKSGSVTFKIEHKGFFNNIAQKFWKRPKITNLHLDELGSYVWNMMDGKRRIVEIGNLVEKKFGENAYPIYPRLAEFFMILEDSRFVVWK